MKYVIAMGQVNGTVAYFGTFDSYVEAEKFMYEELSPKAPGHARMHVIALHTPEYVRTRENVKFI